MNDEDFEGCECELDWRCGYCGPGYAPIELLNDQWAQNQEDEDR